MERNECRADIRVVDAPGWIPGRDMAVEEICLLPFAQERNSRGKSRQ
jgi:hypothetical protein